MSRRCSVGIAGALSSLCLVQGQAEAEQIQTELGTSVSSMLIDRGETLATFNNELSLTLSRETSHGAVYASFYRITPLGNERGAFAEEVDFTLGTSFETTAVRLDVSANYLTYPGSADEATLELAAELGWNHGLAPTLASFYDVDLDIYGAEAFLSSTTQQGPWTLGLITRGGFVSTDDGDYSYAGLEAIAARDITPTIGFEAFARFEISDADTFASNVEGRTITQTASEGLGVGVRLSLRQ